MTPYQLKKEKIKKKKLPIRESEERRELMLDLRTVLIEVTLMKQLEK